MQRAGAVRGALAVVLALGVAGTASAATKEDKAFTVGNYPVEAKAADAVAAKNRAIADAQIAAFRSLLRRIVPVTSYNRITKLRATKVGDLIEGFSVRSERNSATEYIATYDFIFQAEAVRRILDRENIPFLDRQAPTIMLLPVYRAPAGADVPDAFTDQRGSDAWLYAWKGLDLANTLTPVDLKALKREVHPDTIKALQDGDLGTLRTVASEYGSETLVLAILEPDLPQKRLKVTLAGRDAVAPFVLRRVYRIEGGDLAYTAELAAVIGLGVLEGRWKAINIRNVGPQVAGPAAAAAPSPIPRPGLNPEPAESGDGAMRIAVEFRNMGEWQQISRQLSQTPDIADLEVEGLSARGARVSLRYPSGPQALALTLAQQGLILRSAGGTWVLTPR